MNNLFDDKEKIRQLVGAPKTCLKLVPADDIYCDFVFSVVNDPSTREMSFHSEQISYAEHKVWWASQISEQLPFYIALFENEPCGYARFDKNKGTAKIAVAIAPAYRGRGFSSKLIIQACKKVFEEAEITCIQAYVKPENKASIRAFKKVQFVEAKDCTTKAVCFYYPEKLV